MLRQLLTEEQTSDTLGISVDELRALREASAGPDHFAITMRVVRYDADDVTTWRLQAAGRG